MTRTYRLGDGEHTVRPVRHGPSPVLAIDGHEVAAWIDEPNEYGWHGLGIDDDVDSARVVRDGDVVWVHAAGRAWRLEPVDVLTGAGQTGGAGGNAAIAPMPGTVLSVEVKPGDAVKDGDALMVIESMKLETTITAWRDGWVASIGFEAGATFDKGMVLITLEAEEEG